MPGAQRREHADRSVPVLARLVRVDGGGLFQFAGAVDDRDLDAGADPGIEPHGHPLAGRCGKQQVVQVASEHPDCFGFRLLAQLLFDLAFEVRQQLDLPGPAHGLGQPRVGGATGVAHAGATGDAPFRFARARGATLVGERQREPQDAFLAAAQQREHAVRGNLLHRFAGAEVVGELGPGVLLARHDRGCPVGAIPQQLTQAADQLRILREHLDQDPARAFERRGDVGNALVRVDVARRPSPPG